MHTHTCSLGQAAIEAAAVRRHGTRGCVAARRGYRNGPRAWALAVSGLCAARLITVAPSANVVERAANTSGDRACPTKTLPIPLPSARTVQPTQPATTTQGSLPYLPGPHDYLGTLMYLSLPLSVLSAQTYSCQLRRASSWQHLASPFVQHRGSIVGIAGLSSGSDTPPRIVMRPRAGPVKRPGRFCTRPSASTFAHRPSTFVRPTGNS
ncbi:hypothetical protein CDD83_3337 [Cordyceps sp. RAO-2017]|nr:hypothetical protein CDD83_3337 [Cordyceps sp. RAO-2017]